MSGSSAYSREKLLRILALMAVAALTLGVAVWGLVAYSAQIIDGVQRQSETTLAERRVARTLARLREDVTSASVWNDAYDAMLAGDQAWLQVNFGDYYADYMHHEVTLAYDVGGRVIYASRDSEPVPPANEAALIAAARPLVESVRREGAARGRRVGLEAVATRQAVVVVAGAPYFICVSTVVRETTPRPSNADGDPVVVSGMKVASFVPSFAADLGLDSPRLETSQPLHAPFVRLVEAGGKPAGFLIWTPARPGRELLMRAAPVLALLLAVMMLALTLGGWRIYRLICALAANEKALDESLQAAESANAAKSQFLANMSHELRTPLNGIIAMSELLRARQSDAQSREMADTVIASGRTLESVVNDILDVSKIEAGQLRFEIAPFDLGGLLREVGDLHGAAAAAKGVALDIQIMPGADGVYQGDRNRLAQVVSNLLSNAVKFTERGAVRVRVKRTRAGLRIAVADTGIGFDRATAGRLFQRFEQADLSVSRKFGGTGLGLSITSSLLAMMGGRIAVRATPGLGALFVVYAPLPRLGDSQAETAPQGGVVEGAAIDADQIRVLFAEDNEINRRVVGLILAPLNVELTHVRNGAEAVEAARAGDYDLILMDVQMPVMDGLTATREIRAFEASEMRARTPVIFLTANAMPEDLARSREAGGDLHIAKPVRPEALIEAIQTVLTGAVAAAA